MTFLDNELKAGLKAGAECSLTEKVKYILGRRAGFKGGGLEYRAEGSLSKNVMYYWGWRAGMMGGGLEDGA